VRLRWGKRRLNDWDSEDGVEGTYCTWIDCEVGIRSKVDEGGVRKK
jgi:hypothetical protein